MERCRVERFNDAQDFGRVGRGPGAALVGAV